MKINFLSTAPHAYPAFDWRCENGNGEVVMYRNPEHQVEGGLREWKAGRHKLSFPIDELCLLMHGRGNFHRQSGEIIEASPFTAVHFKEGWSGTAEIEETVRVSFMRCIGGPSETTPVLRDVLHAGPLAELGPVSKPIVGISQRAGLILSRNEPKRAESGIWSCSPGTWRCEVKSDEFCHFLAGSSTYLHDDGDRIEVQPDTLAFFPAGWKGNCEIRETVRKVYLIR